MTLAELVINLTANTATLQNDFQKAGRMAESAAASMKSVLSGIGIGLSVAGLAEAVKSMADYGTEVSIAAQKTATTTEEISALKFAAEESDIQFESLQKSLERFSKNIDDSGLGSKKARQAMDDLGISSRDVNGNLLPTHELLLEVADAFSKNADSGQKTAIAMALFGKSGADLIPLLDRGKSGIEELEKRAADLGIVMSEQAAMSARQFNEELTALEAAGRGLMLKWSGDLLPTLTLLMELLQGNKYAVAEFHAELELLSISLGAEVADLTNFLGMNNTALNGMAEQATEVVTRQHQALVDMQKGLQIPTVGKGVGGLDIPQPAMDHVKQITAYIENLRQEIVKLDGGDVTAGLVKLASMGASPAQLIQANALLEQIEQMKDAKKELADYNKAQAEGQKLMTEWEPTLTPLMKAWSDYYNRLDQIEELGEKGINTQSLQLESLSKLENALQELADKSINFTGPRALDYSKLLPNVSVFNLVHDKFASLDADAYNLGEKMSSAFSQMIIYGRNFKDSLTSLIDLFGQFIVKTYLFSAVSSELMGIGNGTGILGVVGAFFGGLAGKASGGDVSSGTPYLVGEQGPELFVPSSSGTIIPNGAAARSGMTVIVNAQGADGGVEYRVQRGIAAGMRQAAINGALLAQESARRS